jgi:hypothetical protein
VDGSLLRGASFQGVRYEGLGLKPAVGRVEEEVLWGYDPKDG